MSVYARSGVHFFILLVVHDPQRRLSNKTLTLYLLGEGHIPREWFRKLAKTPKMIKNSPEGSQTSFHGPLMVIPGDLRRLVTILDRKDFLQVSEISGVRHALPPPIRYGRKFLAIWDPFSLKKMSFPGSKTR